MNELPDDIETITKEINEYASLLGELAWKIGKRTLGERATALQIANYLSRTDFGLPGGFPATMILNFMERTKQNESS